MKQPVVRMMMLLALIAVSAQVLPANAPPATPQAKAIKALVEKAAKEIDQKGAAAFAEFRVKGSEWFHDNTYLFVYNMDGKLLLNAARPQNEGRQGGGRARSPTNPQTFTAAFIETAKTKGAGWVDYMFAKPGQTDMLQKWSYVKRVTIDGTPGLVGAGFYPNK